MKRTLTYSITTAYDGLRIELFLRKRGYSKQNLTEIKRMPQSVLLNGKFVYMKDILHTGDTLVINICEEECSEKIPPVDIPLNIVYEDEDIIVINKPAGMPIHPSMDNYTNSMANALAFYYKQQGKPFIFRCNNRLDRDTSGLTVVAKHLVSASILSDAVSRKDVQREYMAICAGHVTPSCGTIDVPLSRKPGTIIERTVDFAHGERAVTHYEVQEYYQNHSLVRLRLETGRTHQIRIHMKHLGYPLIGDYLYNPDMELIKRQALHSYRLRFVHPITGNPMEFTADLPDDFKQALASNQI